MRYWVRVGLLRSFIIALASLGAISCHASTTHPFVLSQSGPTLEFQGSLVGEASTALRRALEGSADGITTLVITSPGGQAPEAMVIGRLLYAKHIDVVVRGYCISACAQYIFAAGRRKIISPHSILGFHGSPTIMAEYLKASNQAAAQLFAPTEKQEAEFYEMLGMRPSLPMIVASKLIPICLAEDGTRPSDDVSHYGIAYAYTIFVPSAQQLQALGIENVQGWWPSQDAIRSELTRQGFSAALHPRYEADAPVTSVAIPVSAHALPQCPRSVR